MQPPGVLIRPAPDFFDDNINVGGALIVDATATTQTYFSVALFNNALAGQLFKVYAISGFSNFGGGIALFFVKGTFGALFANCNPVRADLAALYGQIYTQQAVETVSGLSPYFSGATPIGHVGTAGESETHIFPFPAFIVPVGYSLVAANTDAASGNGASKTCGGAFFWYQVANE